MIVQVSPTETNAGETVASLSFAEGSFRRARSGDKTSATFRGIMVLCYETFGWSSFWFTFWYRFLDMSFEPIKLINYIDFRQKAALSPNLAQRHGTQRQPRRRVRNDGRTRSTSQEVTVAWTEMHRASQSDQCLSRKYRAIRLTVFRRKWTILALKIFLCPLHHVFYIGFSAEKCLVSITSCIQWSLCWIEVFVRVHWIMYSVTVLKTLPVRIHLFVYPRVLVSKIFRFALEINILLFKGIKWDHYNM